MANDFIIRNATIVDPYNDLFEKKDIAVKGGKIHYPGRDESCENEFSGEGLFVSPGFIDFHTHVFFRGSGYGINPDLFFADGVTTTVDAGTAGSDHYDLFHNSVVANAQMEIKAQINISSIGQPGNGINEDFSRLLEDKKKIAALAQKYREEIIGIKIRYQKGVVPDTGVETLEKVVAFCREIDLPIVIHVTDPPVMQEEILRILQKNDVFCHCFHGSGESIVKDGRIIDEAHRARERGVIFDDANGSMNFAFQTAQTAINEGFFPDFISSDTVRNRTYRKKFKTRNLPFIMARHFSLGLDLSQIIAMVTRNPAAYLGEPVEKGSLTEGSTADLAVFAVVEEERRHVDALGEEVICDRDIAVKMTAKKGEIVFASNDIW